MSDSITIDAVFENGVFRPNQPLLLPSPQRVTLTVQLRGKKATVWPDDVAQIYQEIAEEDRRIAAAMEQTLRSTWPRSEETP